MTKSPTTSSPTLPQSEAVSPARWSWGRAFLTLLFRLLLLGVGGSLAAAVGIAVAQLYSGQIQEPPLAEKLLQSTQSLIGSIKQLPNDWQGQPETAPSPSASSISAAPSEATPLSATERQQLQTELTQLQAELQTLTSNSAEPLADRVQPIQQRIQAIQSRLSTFTSAPATSETFIAPTSSNNHQLMVTLPSDALFGTGQTSLKPGTEAIFNSILTDLQRYPGATIQVGGHTDNQGDSTADRQRSTEQAKAVQQFLATRLGEDIHWVTVGYGANRPLAANDTPTNQQRNRRIEIVIEPK